MAEELKACPCGAPAEKEPYAITQNNDLFRLDCTRADCGWCVVSPSVQQAFIDWNARAQLPSQGGEAVGEVRALSDGKQYAALYTMAGQHLVGEKLYTHPADQVAEGVVVSRELLENCADYMEGSKSMQVQVWHDQLRQLLAKSEGVKT